jgi:vacuolar-type H+-ATPase catalytic subunit A/Vma1
MKASSIYDIQKELKTHSPKELMEFCMRLAKYKKENKELLTYLMFEAQDEKNYVESVKIQLTQLFEEINRQSTYTTKKGLQKIVRVMNRFIKYSDKKTTELELRIFFCKKVKSERINITASTVISNLYEREKKKIEVCLSKLHEDLQYDFQQELETL